MTDPPASLLFSQSFLIKIVVNLKSTIHLDLLQIKNMTQQKKPLITAFFINLYQNHFA